MNQNQLYIPNHDKWVKYYDHIGTTEHPVYVRSGNRKTSDKTGGSIGKQGERRIIPVENVPHKGSNNTGDLKVELVSPVQQVVEQAASEIKRQKRMQRKQSVPSSKLKRRKKAARKAVLDEDQF